MNTLKEAKLSLLSNKECKNNGASLNVDIEKEICAWKKNNRKILVLKTTILSNGQPKLDRIE